jgi:uncharacterized protein (DUF1501 family)
MDSKKKMPSIITRRKFMGYSACSAMTTASLLNSILSLRQVNAAVGENLPADAPYKALVCVFLFEGNDSANMLMPRESAAHARYVASRGVLGLPLDAIAPLNADNDTGLELGIHGAMQGCRELFSAGKLAMLANVGTLVGPATLQDYQNRTAAIPEHLFSHSDQQVAWQTSADTSNAAFNQTGWGGRMADCLSGTQQNGAISMLVSLNGTNFFQVGNTMLPFRMGSNGAPAYKLGQGTREYEQTRYGAFRSILNAGSANLMEDAFADLSNKSIRDSDTINAALENSGDFEMIPDSGLGNQLRMVAKIVQAREALGMKRQIFFCATGGYDTHGPQVGAHAGLLAGLSGAMKGFNDAVASINAEESVTTFTASDFGRTYDSNGRGSDHGWGGHHLIMGGAVNGKNVYGTFPNPDITTGTNPLDTGRGRWLPTTSVDQYGATLGRWFGLSESQIPEVFPNIGNFASTDLGFMKA